MTKLKYTLRIFFFLLFILLLIYLNKKSNDHTKSIAEFKFEMLKKITKDSLDSKQKAELVYKETTAFVESSARVRKGFQWLIGLVALVVVAEIAFFAIEKKSGQRGNPLNNG